MKHKEPIIAVLLALVIGFFVGRWYQAMRNPTGDRTEWTSLISVSPDQSREVLLVEIPAFLDRNFEVRIASGDQPPQTVFRSPDEGMPIGTERIVWSGDGDRFVLLGREFSVVKGGNLEDGRQLYLMYDCGSAKLWCNAQQVTQYPRFTPTDLEGTAWKEEGDIRPAD